MRTIQADQAIRHFIYEAGEWKRLFVFLKQENVFRKSMLAEVVSDLDDDETLIRAEELNEEFTAQDRMVEFLSSELNKHIRFLEANIYENDGLLRQVMTYQKKLRTDIWKAEELISAAKKRFSLFLSDVFQNTVE
jgi:hypothetical protein